jgi:prepilin-type processing-associated H-X9-DG protein
VSTRRKNLALLAAVVGPLLLGMCATPFPVTALIFCLTFGWIWYLRRVLPNMVVRWDLVASTAAYAAVLLVGAHFFLRWLRSEMTPPGMGRAWKWSWTVGGFLLVLLAFAAGISVVGVVHQTGWLISSPEPLYHRSHASADRIRCQSNLRQIGQALQMYANENGGRLPDDFSTLLLKEDLIPAVFTCPRSDDVPAEGSTPQEQAENLKKPDHCSYRYFGKGLSLPLADDRILALEPLENHEREGINVLYGDGHVDWVPSPPAEDLLRRMTEAASRPTSAPAVPTTQR